MKKITIGYVIQDVNESGECVGQKFIACYSAIWEDDDGNSIDCPQNEKYHPFDMLQPIVEI